LTQAVVACLVGRRGSHAEVEVLADQVVSPLLSSRLRHPDLLEIQNHRLLVAELLLEGLLSLKERGASLGVQHHPPHRHEALLVVLERLLVAVRATGGSGRGWAIVFVWRCGAIVSGSLCCFLLFVSGHLSRGLLLLLVQIRTNVAVGVEDAELRRGEGKRFG
jgi:hypothetical protein